MANIKLVIKMFNVILASVWGLTVVDLVEAIIEPNETLVNLKDSISIYMIIAGAIYFTIQLPNKYRNNIIEREIKKEELEKLKRENDEAE